MPNRKRSLVLDFSHGLHDYWPYNVIMFGLIKTNCWWLALQDNEELGLVQARWSFVNKDENLLTRLQNVNLAFHFEVEQQVNSVFLNFFGFNGTAGVWRIKALEEAGGWLERTTVEDMDIAVRAHLHGWKFIFLNDVEVPYSRFSTIFYLRKPSLIGVSYWWLILLLFCAVPLWVTRIVWSV